MNSPRTQDFNTSFDVFTVHSNAVYVRFVTSTFDLAKFQKYVNFKPHLLLNEASHNFSHRDINYKGCNAPPFCIGIKFLGVLVEE